MIDAYKARCLSKENRNLKDSTHELHWRVKIDNAILQAVKNGQDSCTIEMSKYTPLDVIIPMLRTYNYNVSISEASLDNYGELVISWRE